MTDEEYDRELSPYCRAHNAVSLFLDQKSLHQLDRLDWKTVAGPNGLEYEVEAEKDGKIGKAKGSEIAKIVREAVDGLGGFKSNKKSIDAGPAIVSIGIASSEKSIWQCIWDWRL